MLRCSRRYLSRRDAFHRRDLYQKVCETTLDRPLSMTFKGTEKFLIAFHHIRRGFPRAMSSDTFTYVVLKEAFKVSHRHEKRDNEK